jgi:thiosulfate dehydrogenase
MFINKQIVFVISIIAIITLCFNCKNCSKTNAKSQALLAVDSLYSLPDTSTIPNDDFGAMVRYGRQLMVNTALLIGPNGQVGSYAKNQVNCTNCHREAGTLQYAYNLMLSHNKYPSYRARENAVLTLADRVNNCIERPLNGKPLPLNSKEMVAYLSYFKWINSKVTNKNAKGLELAQISLPETAANPVTGKQLYSLHCLRCHGNNGEGLLNTNKIDYKYPPLWGSQSYQKGSSMHRVIKQAKWLKMNMPQDSAVLYKPYLTDKEALDIAAFINNDVENPRPLSIGVDYPNLKTKNIDYGTGPFIDTFSATQHKYGPWLPIINYWKNIGLKPEY